MILNVSASYQPNEDEVWVDFRSTEDDTITATVADSLKVELLIEHKNDIGAVSYIPISECSVTSDYVRPDKNYELVFRNPPRTMDLWINVSATYGATTVQKRVSVGIALPSHTSMDLPDNVLWEKDPFDMPETGGYDYTPNTNTVVLAPEIRMYSEAFDFTVGNAVEDYEGLSYSGGGNRLWISNQNDRLTFQALDQSPWSLSTFAFLEGGSQNLMPNPFFQTVVNPSSDTTAYPNGYEVDAAGTVLNQKVDFDYAITEAAKLWTLRFIQTSVMPAFNEVSLKLTAPVAVTAGGTYTFSTYGRVRNMSRDTMVNKFILKIKWFTNTTLTSTSEVILNPANFRSLNLAHLTAVAPAGVTHAQPAIHLSALDTGDDVELALLGFQLEAGDVVTTRMNGTRQADLMTIDQYNASNQRVRLELIPGFASGSIDRQIIQGPINVTFLSSGDIEVEVPDASTTLSVPLSFPLGDVLDLTIEHQAGKKVAVYKAGQLVGDTPLPDFTSTVAPLNILGVGVELLKLTVFSRRGD